MVFLEISLLCNFILGLFYQNPQSGFILTSMINLLVGAKNVLLGIEIVSLGLWMFFMYLIVEKWQITPPDAKNIGEFVVQGIVPVGTGCIFGGMVIASTMGAKYSTTVILGSQLTTYVNSYGEFIANFFSVGMVLLVVFNTAMILFMYITLYNNKLNRDTELEQNKLLANSPKINHL